MKPLLISCGEPAGIGPDLCSMIQDLNREVVIAGDKQVLIQRAEMLKQTVRFVDYKPGYLTKAHEMQVWNFPCEVPVIPGKLDKRNASVVLKMLKETCLATLQQSFSALVTAPVHKAQLQQIDQNFFGHTEFFQKYCQAENVVMLLASKAMKVALVTAHLPLSEVPKAITQDKIISVAKIVHAGLQQDFGIKNPRIAISGLNPHAGEQGILGCEEQITIIPAIKSLRDLGLNVEGPYPADTMFLESNVDAFIAMYHDQGLAVLKYASFGEAANISLGLPIIRTSVDHGTALSLAGTGRVHDGSLRTAIDFARQMVQHRGI